MTSGSAPPWQLGDSLEELVLPEVSRLDLIRYAGASGDYNPIHTIDAEAERAGLSGIIQHGMLTMAQMSQLLTPYLENGYIEHLQTRFVGMLFLGERLRITAEVTELENGGDGQRFGFQVAAKTDDGRMIAKGMLRFVWLAAEEVR